MFYRIDPMYFMIVGPAFLFAMLASWMVKSTFAKYSRIASRSGMRGVDAARAILKAGGIGVENSNAGGKGMGISVERVGGRLSDHFDPRLNVIRLSDAVYSSNSLAALGVAAHEAGHALQHAHGYLPIKIRNLFVPIASLGSGAAFPLFFLGMIMNNPMLAQVAIALFGGVVAFQIITLPVEFNASSRARRLLVQHGILSADEAKGAGKVLSAAAMTYLAAALQAILTLLYYIMRSRR